MTINGNIAFVGCGNMGGALLSGLLAGGATLPGNVQVAEAHEPRRGQLARDHGVSVVADVRGLRDVDLMILAVKPADVAACLGPASAALKPGALVVSLAAGVRIGAVAAGLASEAAVVRAMPNTPALVGKGVTALAAGPGVTEGQMAQAEAVFQAVGRVVRVAEKQMDAVTGLSGSGPAYIYMVIEALADAGVLEGLPRPVALDLAAATVAGAAEMVIASGMHPAALKDQVTSPGGTTIMGVRALEKGGLRAALMEAVAQASARSRELSNY